MFRAVKLIVRCGPARVRPSRSRACALGVEPLECRLVPATIQFLGEGGIGSLLALNGVRDERVVPAAAIADYVIPPVPEGSGFSPLELNSLRDSSGPAGASVSTVFNVWEGPNSRFFPNSPVVTLDLQPGFSLRSATPTSTGTFTAGTTGAAGYGSDLQVRILPEAPGEHIGDPVTLILQASFSRLSYGYEPGAQGQGDPNLTMSYAARYTIGGQTATLLSGVHTPPGGVWSQSGPGTVFIQTRIGETFGVSLLASGGGTTTGSTGPGLTGELYYGIGFVGQNTPPRWPTVLPPKDPNSKSGADGYGPQEFVPADAVIPYRVDFENFGPGSTPLPPFATGPAQRVEIRDQLPDELDWGTVSFTGFGFGDELKLVPAGQQNYSAVVPTKINGQSYQVNVELSFDPSTGRLVAAFQTLDPATGLPPAPGTGFLLPEDGTGKGHGFVAYSARPAARPSGTEIRNVALIQFDNESVIATNQINVFDASQGTDPAKEALATIDAEPPTATIVPLPAIAPAETFTISWAGDDGAGSGVASYDVYVSTDGGPLARWLSGTLQTSATFTGASGHRYGFAVRATDHVGLRPAVPVAAQAGTQVGPPPVTAPPAAPEPAPAGGGTAPTVPPPAPVLTASGGAVRQFDSAAVPTRTLVPFSEFGGEVRVATGDVDGDGVADTIAAIGSAGPAHVKVFSGATGAEVFSFYAFDPLFLGGVSVAAGDVDGDGRADIVVAAGAGGSGHLKVFSGATGAELLSVLSYAGYNGATSVAVGDVNGDGRADIVTSSGAGTRPHVKVFSGAGGLMRSFFAFDADFLGGVAVAAGDVDGDGRADIVAGSGPGSRPHTKVFSGATGAELASYFAYDAGFAGGVRVSARDVDGDGFADVVAGSGPGTRAHIKVFSGRTNAVVESYFADDSSHTGGVWVA
ncbi:VCBS repeat-containing protein [Gemmata sp. JC673]|uniref:VCBS repeat-containing protein n=1 Tax=Gemmata algarum TaxID=2975278 RepID=A0ABU5F533_9BACT|nr:VCBS repeat-containing protein [Gemmata algarum]MDY3561912.1 VCBS repeat-containing protein [Gemmata algarum]